MFEVTRVKSISYLKRDAKLRPFKEGTMFPCSLKIIGQVPLFPKSDFQNFYVPCTPKLVLFPCSLKLFDSVPLFSETK